jgi:hypothetical protein
MSRPTLIYFFVLLASAAGVMLILERGKRLSAPPELSGEWHVLGSDSGSNSPLGKTVLIEQSGRFLRFSFERGLEVDMKLESQIPAPNGPTTRHLDQMQFSGSDWKLTTLGATPAGPLSCTLSGPEQHRFILERASANASR